MASQPICQLYAELKECKIKIWRRFQVMNNITMAKLGYILMTLFEMQFGHMFCFEVPVAENFRKCAGELIDMEINEKVVDLFNVRPELRVTRVEMVFDEDDIEYEGRTLDAKKTKLKNVLTEQAETMTFLYDFGDGWEIRCELEKIIVDISLPGRELPRVIEGEGYGIIEDCGGPRGLEEIAAAFKRKKGEKYDRYLEWVGYEIDIASFDLERMNRLLKKTPGRIAEAYEQDF